MSSVKFEVATLESQTPSTSLVTVADLNAVLRNLNAVLHEIKTDIDTSKTGIETLKTDIDGLSSKAKTNKKPEDIVFTVYGRLREANFTPVESEINDSLKKSLWASTNALLPLATQFASDKPPKPDHAKYLKLHVILGASPFQFTTIENVNGNKVLTINRKAIMTSPFLATYDTAAYNQDKNNLFNREQFIVFFDVFVKSDIQYQEYEKSRLAAVSAASQQKSNTTASDAVMKATSAPPPKTKRASPTGDKNPFATINSRNNECFKQLIYLAEFILRSQFPLSFEKAAKEIEELKNANVNVNQEASSAEPEQTADDTKL